MLGQSLLQIGAGITNWGKLLQIRAQHIYKFEFYFSNVA